MKQLNWMGFWVDFECVCIEVKVSIDISTSNSNRKQKGSFRMQIRFILMPFHLRTEYVCGCVIISCPKFPETKFYAKMLWTNEVAFYYRNSFNCFQEEYIQHETEILGKVFVSFSGNCSGIMNKNVFHFWIST